MNFIIFLFLFSNGIDTSVTSAQIESNQWTQVVETFDEMDLKEELLRGIFAYGFEKPSAIQQRAIMPVIKGKLS